MASGLVAITGANGFVGRHVVQRLGSQGIATVGLVRTGRELQELGRTTRTLSEWSEMALRGALNGVDSIVHAASVVHRPGATAAEYQAFNVDGTRALVAAASACGVRRIVFLSTIKVYGEEPAGILDEDTALDRSSPYSSTKIDAEQIILGAALRGGPEAVVLRLCPVYGIGDKGNVRRVATAIARRRFVVPGDGSTRKSIVHVSTVAEAVCRSLSGDARGVFVLSDRNAPSMRELGNLIAQVLGRRPPFGVPVGIVLAAAATLEAVARLRRREPNVSVELIRKSLRSTMCSPARLELALGMRCSVNLHHTIAEEVGWLRRDGLV